MQWAEELGIPFATLRYRIIESKWPVEDAFTLEIGSVSKNPNGTPPTPSDQYNANRRSRYQINHDSRETYIENQKDKTKRNLDALGKVMKENPGISKRKAAQMLGVSESYVRKLLKVDQV